MGRSGSSQDGASFVHKGPYDYNPLHGRNSSRGITKSARQCSFWGSRAEPVLNNFDGAGQLPLLLKGPMLGGLQCVLPVAVIKAGCRYRQGK